MDKKFKHKISILAIFTFTMMFCNMSFMLFKSKEVKAVESQYSGGGYDSGAVQPNGFNWTRQSQYLGGAD